MAKRTTQAAPPARAAAPRRIAVALQGGGSHGAYTWGVLDRLLEEPSLEIVTITGTSAGAMNAGVLADGLRRGGREQARSALDAYWASVGAVPGLAGLTAMLTGVRPGAFGEWHFDGNPLYVMFDLMSRVLSPYQTNPLNQNPLRPLLNCIDYEGLRTDPKAPQVFICATNVRTGMRRTFTNKELSVDVLLASACLPHVFQAIMIDGEPYWDGGYTGNPALAPVYMHSNATDMIIVGINPLVRDAVPTTSRDIISRIDEIGFNSTFLLELSSIAFIESMLESGHLKPGRFTQLYLHGIATDVLATLGASSKMNNHIDFLQHLRGLGRECADNWLRDNLDAVGSRSTVDLHRLMPGSSGTSVQSGGA